LIYLIKSTDEWLKSETRKKKDTDKPYTRRNKHMQYPYFAQLGITAAAGEISF